MIALPHAIKRFSIFPYSGLSTMPSSFFTSHNAAVILSSPAIAHPHVSCHLLGSGCVVGVRLEIKKSLLLFIIQTSTIRKYPPFGIFSPCSTVSPVSIIRHQYFYLVDIL